MRVTDPNNPPSGRAVGGGGAPDLRRPSERWKAPPLVDALPPPPQRATPARKGTHCGDGAGSPRLQRPHLGHTGRGTPAARPRGQVAGGGTARDTRRPSQRWQATPPGDGPPPPPRHAAPTGHAGQGNSVGPPHEHTRAHSTWVADPNSPPSGRAVGGGGAPDLRRPSQGWKAPPPGTPFRHPLSEQRRPARAHAVGPVLGGRADAAGARAHTHAKSTRGLPEGQPDRARGTHRQPGMAYRRARVRDTRTGRPATRSAGHAGREGGNGRDTTQGTALSPPNRPRAPRTHGRGTAPAKPQPLG